MPATFDFQWLYHSLIVGVLLFALGMVGFMARRNVPVMMISLGVMLQGVVLTLTAFGTFHGTWSGQIFSLVVLVVAIALGVIAAAVMVALARAEGSLDPDRLRRLGNEAASDEPRSLPHGAGVAGGSAPFRGEHSAVSETHVTQAAGEGIDD